MMIGKTKSANGERALQPDIARRHYPQAGAVSARSAPATIRSITAPRHVGAIEITISAERNTDEQRDALDDEGIADPDREAEQDPWRQRRGIASKVSDADRAAIGRTGYYLARDSIGQRDSTERPAASQAYVRAPVGREGRGNQSAPVRTQHRPASRGTASGLRGDLEVPRSLA